MFTIQTAILPFIKKNALYLPFLTFNTCDLRYIDR